MKTSPNDDFYVGYLSNAPARYARFAKRVAAGLLLGAVVAAVLLVLHQHRFSTSTFEFGTLTEVEGVLLKTPAPMLKIRLGTDAADHGVFQTALLINYQKFGADSLVAGFERTLRRPLDQTVVKLRGSLIYHDGVLALELTEGEKAFRGAVKAIPSEKPSLTDLGEVALRGEIVDPKCFFGVMKPGQAKPHRSCAIRCIAGGMPPVLLVKNERGETGYYLLTDQTGRALHEQVLDYVAEPVELRGYLTRRDGWNVLSLDPTTDLARLSLPGSGGLPQVALCGATAQPTQPHD